jgi:hypothetical protein
MELQPGFIEGDTVAHCGNTLKGQFCRTLTTTDVFLGWSENVAMENNAHENILKGLKTLEMRYPYEIKGYDFDNGSEFINYDVVMSITARDIKLTRSRPYKKNDNAHVEQKNNDIVRRNVNYYRYDTPEEVNIMNKIYELNHYKFNYFTPTRKAIGYKDNRNKVGQKIRIYDTPKTPLQRLFDSGKLSKESTKALQEKYDQIDPKQLTEEINNLRSKLYELAKDKPESQDKFEPARNRKKKGAII